MARPFTRFPPGARDALTAMAPNGLRESTAARALGMPLREFRRVIKENPQARDLWDECLSIERDALLDAMWNKAQEGDVKAQQFLLAARHNVSDKAPDKPSDRVNITFQLPAAMDPEAWAKAVRVQPEALSNDSPSDQA